MSIIPSSISSSSHATSGEKKVHKIFDFLYGDSEDTIVWYEPPAFDIQGNRDDSQKRLTDFIIYSQVYGVINLEIKDWTINSIKKADINDWEIEVEKNKVVRKPSPLKQSQTCAYGIKNKLSSEKELVHPDGEHKNKLKFPFAYGVVFTRIEREELKQKGFFNGVLDEKLVICKDDLEFEISEKDERLKFEKKLRDMFVQARYSFEPLTHKEIKVLRKSIWPELIVTTAQPIQEKEVSEDIKILDLQQENFAKSLGEGHYLIKGVAGSGKTLVLAYRARYLHKQNARLKILFVCYNISLRKYVEKIITNLLSEKDMAQIDIWHFHDLVYCKTGKSTAKVDNMSSDEWDEHVGMLLRGAIVRRQIKGGKYDVILIDEAQDFSTLWLKGIVGLLSDYDSLTLAFDPAQDIYGRKRIWREADIEVVGGQRSRKLKQSYRNTSEILQLAIKFKGLEEYIDDDDDEHPIPPDMIDRHGEKPIIKKLTNNEAIIEEIKKDIVSQIKKYNYTYKDFAILISSRSFMSTTRVNEYNWEDTPIQLFFTGDERRKLDINDNTVKLITIESSKGLEWKVVYLVGIDEMPRKNRNLKSEKNLVYIGITRAQERLRIYYSKDNELIKTLVEKNNLI